MDLDVEYFGDLDVGISLMKVPILVTWIKNTLNMIFMELLYRVTHLLANQGWVDLDLGSSPGWWAATVATYFPGRMVEHPKSTQPRFASRWVTL